MSVVPINISKNGLIDLYEKKKLTTYQIADIYNCCQATIWKRLHDFNINPRNPWNATNLNKEKLEKLYIKERLSTWQIEKLYGYPRGTVHRKLREFNIKTRDASESHIIYPRNDFSGNKIEKSYLIGFSMGDLRIRKKGLKSKTIHIDCASTKKEQIDLIKKLFNKYGRVWISRPNRRKVIQIECSLNSSFFFLLKNRKLADKWIVKNKKYFLSFIAGFIDAEGCISISGRGTAYFSLGNYNKKLLIQIRNFLIKNKVFCPKLSESKTKGRLCFGKYFHNQNYWHIQISKKTSLIRLFNFISSYLKHASKIKNMKLAIKNIKERNIKFGNLRMNYKNI